jgi:hypothetical protein
MAKSRQDARREEARALVVGGSRDRIGGREKEIVQRRDDAEDAVR